MQNFEQHSANSNLDPKPNAVTDQQVLIAGGGHVGLSFALLLAHHGIKSTLLEKNSYPEIGPEDDAKRSHYLDSRNTALSRRTVQ
ncbi:MAG: FAD-dependent oxidoreductase, partial [Psychrobacter sp.]